MRSRNHTAVATADGRCADKIGGVRMSRVLRIAVTAGTTLWVMGLFLMPAALFPLGRHICHQRPTRSFFVHGQQMPVCARCTGLYVGAAVAAPIALLAATAMASARARRVF